MATKQKIDHKAKAIEALLSNGWKANGQTMQQTFRVGTVETPIYGGIGGKLVTTGGRDRFVKGHWSVTVGKRTTYFWSSGIRGSAHLKTNNFEAIAKQIEECDRP